MSDWGRATFGDPCRQCGFSWDMPQPAALALVARVPDELEAMLGATDGRQRKPDLTWSAGAYVCHIADNLRIWAERLAGLAAGDPGPVAPYDQDLLAEARRYDRVALAGALWSVRRSARDWADAVHEADAARVTLVHPERGALGVLDVVRTNAHDAHHHVADIAAILRCASSPPAPPRRPPSLSPADGRGR
jgi:hypothetical protein